MDEVNLVAGDEFVVTATGAGKIRFELEGLRREDGRVRDAIAHRNEVIETLRQRVLSLEAEESRLLRIFARLLVGDCGTHANGTFYVDESISLSPEERRALHEFMDSPLVAEARQEAIHEIDALMAEGDRDG